jgi:hypothetical protein
VPLCARSFVSLFVLLTASNNPRVMMPAYRSSRPSVLFFAGFVTLGVFGLMQVQFRGCSGGS